MKTKTYELLVPNLIGGIPPRAQLCLTSEGRIEWAGTLDLPMTYLLYRLVAVATGQGIVTGRQGTYLLPTDVVTFTLPEHRGSALIASLPVEGVIDPATSKTPVTADVLNKLRQFESDLSTMATNAAQNTNECIPVSTHTAFAMRSRMTGILKLLVETEGKASPVEGRFTDSEIKPTLESMIDTLSASHRAKETSGTKVPLDTLASLKSKAERLLKLYNDAKQEEYAEAYGAGPKTLQSMKDDDLSEMLRAKGIPVPPDMVKQIGEMLDKPVSEFHGLIADSQKASIHRRTLLFIERCMDEHLEMGRYPDNRWVRAYRDMCREAERGEVTTLNTHLDDERTPRNEKTD